MELHRSTRLLQLTDRWQYDGIWLELRPVKFNIDLLNQNLYFSIKLLHNCSHETDQTMDFPLKITLITFIRIRYGINKWGFVDFSDLEFTCSPRDWWFLSWNPVKIYWCFQDVKILGTNSSRGTLGNVSPVWDFQAR